MLAFDLLAPLRCPVSKQPLIYFPRGPESTSEADACFVCPSSSLRYRVDDGVPVLLAEEAVRLAPAELKHLLERAQRLDLPVPE